LPSLDSLRDKILEAAQKANISSDAWEVRRSLLMAGWAGSDVTHVCEYRSKDNRTNPGQERPPVVAVFFSRFSAYSFCIFLQRNYFYPSMYKFSLERLVNLCPYPLLALH